jgi:5-formyltetrahydrofolate cyclo-ligase
MPVIPSKYEIQVESGWCTVTVDLYGVEGGRGGGYWDRILAAAVLTKRAGFHLVSHHSKQMSRQQLETNFDHPFQNAL